MQRQCLPWLLVISLLLSGCWDRREVNDLAIISTVGLDQADEGLTLTVRVVVPSRSRPSGGGQTGADTGRTSVVFSATGRTIMDAAKKIQLRSSRWLFWGQARVLVVGQQLADAGLGPVLDFWRRHREPRQTMQIAVAADTALALLQAEPGLERLLSEALRETLNMRLQTRVSLNEFGNALSAPGSQPIAPVVTAEPGIMGGANVRILGTAVFSGDRMVGQLDWEETRGLLWLLNEISGGVVTVDIGDQGQVSLTLTEGKSRVEPRFAGGRLQRIEVAILGRGDISETAGPLDLDNPAVVKAVEWKAAAAIRDRVESVILRMQKDLRTDAAGFGDAVRRHNLPLWEGGLKRRWSDLFPEVPVTVQAHMRIERVGGHGSAPGLTPGYGG